MNRFSAYSKELGRNVLVVVSQDQTVPNPSEDYWDNTTPFIFKYGRFGRDNLDAAQTEITSSLLWRDEWEEEEIFVEDDTADYGGRFIDNPDYKGDFGPYTIELFCEAVGALYDRIDLEDSAVEFIWTRERRNLHFNREDNFVYDAGVDAEDAKVLKSYRDELKMYYDGDVWVSTVIDIFDWIDTLRQKESTAKEWKGVHELADCNESNLRLLERLGEVIDSCGGIYGYEYAHGKGIEETFGLTDVEELV